MEYTYPGANNGRIASSTDHQSGELVNYTYDSLNRLVKAETAGAGWGDAYTYDGFGNLLGMTPTKQGGLTSSTPVDAATNRLVGVNYDANGNQTGDAITVNGWDVENRLATQISGGYGGMAYAYDPFGRRALKNWNSDPTGQHGGTGFTDGNSGPATATWEFYFYGITGQKLVTIECGYHDEGGAGPTPSCQIGNNGYNTNVYFGGKLLSANGVRVATDRLGSVRNSNGQLMNYFPYGQERTTTADGREKFATYFRDGVGQDYAEQRYYGNGAGRFLSPDRGGTGTEKRDPVTWNRYAYVAGDPVNLHDPRGRELMFAIQDVTSGSYDCTAFLAEGPGENPEVYVSWVDCVAVGTSSYGLPGSGGPAGVDSAPGPDPPDPALAQKKDARADLAKTDCYRLLGFNSADQAQKWFDNNITFNELHQGNLQLAAGAPSPNGPAAASTAGMGTVNLNIDYNWADLSKVTTSRGGTYDFLGYINRMSGLNMTSEQLGTLMIIHELLHQDVLPLSARPSHDESIRAQKRIYNDCIK